ncbi:MAG: hypothetical protein D3903_02745, partial [Candidatus Electrothrix sp. GM3_4]|nr:hypothetical protein [Candidatus Electrothrix sp. GM3_4]
MSLQVSRFNVEPVSQEDINTEVKLMTSKQLMRNAAEKLGFLKKKKKPKREKKRLLVRLGIEYEASHEDNIINKIRSGLDISAVNMSNMIQLTKKGTDPDEITEILQTIIDCYIDLHLKARKNADSAKFYSQELDTHEIKTILLEEKLKEYQKKNAIINPEVQATYTVKLLQLLQERLTRQRVETAQLMTKVDALRSNLTKNGEITLMIEEYRSNEALTQLIKAYVPLVSEKEKVASLYPKSSAEYK